MQFPNLGRKDAFLMAQVKAECPESFSFLMQLTVLTDIYLLRLLGEQK